MFIENKPLRAWLKWLIKVIALATKPDDLNWILRTHVVEEENPLSKIVLSLPHMRCCMCEHTISNSIIDETKSNLLSEFAF